MTTKEQKPDKESWAEFAGMDRVDLVIIVLAVVASALVKYQHWFDDTVPNWVLDLVLPFLLILTTYKVRGWQRAHKERLARVKRWPLEEPNEGRGRDDDWPEDTL